MRIAAGHRGIQPDQLSSSATRAARSRRADRRPCTSQRLATTVCATVRRGSSDANGSWNTMPARRRISRMARRSSAVRSVPSKVTVPASAARGAAARCPASTSRSRTRRPARASRPVDVEVDAVHRPEHALPRREREVHLEPRAETRMSLIAPSPPRTTSPPGAPEPGQDGHSGQKCRSDDGEWGLLGLAPRVGAHRAARPEHAAGRQVGGRRRQAGHGGQVGHPPSGQRRGQVGQRAQQAPRVRVRGALEDVVHRAVLHAPPPVHDQHPVGDAADDAEVVGDPDDAGAVVAPAAARPGR